MSILSAFSSKKAASGMFGISFHDDGIALAHVKRDKHNHQTLDICEFSDLETDETHEDLLQKLMSRHEPGKARCVCVMLPDNYTLLHMEAPDVPSDELRSAVRWRIKDLIDFHIDDAVIDVFDIPGQSSGNGPRMMYVVVARASEVQRYVDLLNDAGLTIEAIDITELALRNMVANMPQDVNGNILLLLNHTTGMISLTHQATLYLSRNISIGSDHLSNAQDAGDSSFSPELENLLGRIVLEVQRSLDYYESHTSSSPVRQITIAPMEGVIPGLVEYLRDEFQMPVSIMDVNEFMDCSQVITPDVQARCSATIGAALRVEATSL